ncbi:MAG: hypothetical protein GF418_07025 [Chitinivibrionales bacterium]|nr:hypothetical protein [Chitinivibrionales bacterium]MBD3395363.1 hypothetical protein [Chitinivibrionales bacterium]
MRYVQLALVFVAGNLLLAGCYTRFATLDRPATLPAEQTETVVDSSGDTVKVVRQVDTVEIRDREVCYWERDLFGRPRLRCYDTYYDDDWYYYHDYPWWYTDYSRYSRYNCHCPYHLHYHPHCRYCWEYCNAYYRHGYYGSGSSGGPAQPSTPGRAPAPSGTRGRSGGSVKTSESGVAGPRPAAKSVKLPKAPARESAGEQRDENPAGDPAVREPSPGPAAGDTTERTYSPPPRRRHGRSR